MPQFSARSRARLSGDAETPGVHPDLVRVVERAIEIVDFAVVEGHRGRAAQEKAFREGKSRLPYPRSPHNAAPSRAVDLAPYPIDWQNRERFFYLAGVVVGVGHALGVGVRWGGDWDRDGESADNRFDDLPHFELAAPSTLPPRP